MKYARQFMIIALIALIGEIEGAMSSLSIVVCGLLTVAAAPLFAMIL